MIRRVFLLLVLSLTVPATHALTAKTAVGRAPQASSLTVDSIIAMAQAGLSEEVIIARLRKDSKAFDLSADDLIKLKKANVSDTVIKTMMDPKADISKPTSAAPQPPAPVGVQPPGVGFPVVNPSGATPTPGSTASGDPNDPLTPHDSGIYLYTKDRNGKPQLVVLERAAYQGTKTGGLLGTALTYGIKKAKTQAIIPGKRASIRTDEGNPEFYFYFDDKAAGLGKSYFGLTNLTSPNQFALLKLDVNKANRETVIMEVGAYTGVSSGTNEKSLVGFKSERLRPGLYKVTMNETLKPGEYCFLASAIPGAYGAGAAGAADIFDFGVSTNQ